MSEIYNRDEIMKLMVAGEIKPLDNLYKIEEVALLIKEIEHKIDIQEGYKKNRIEAINGAITGLENKVDFYKKIILATLETNKEKSISFPGSCKISTRKPIVKWVIENEDEFLKILETEGEKYRVGEDRTEYKYDKKKINQLLDSWEKMEKLPTAVRKDVGEKIVSISFEAPSSPSIEDQGVEVPVKTEQYDGIEF